MVNTASTMLALGSPIPDFRLPDVVSGDFISLDMFTNSRALLVMFICEHCPFVKHVEQQLAQLGKDYSQDQLGIVAISANDAENYPADAPENLKKMAKRLDFSFPYCHDATQSVAKAFHAACTPDFFLFNEQRLLVYRGRLDRSRPGNDAPVDGSDLRTAIDALLAGQPVDERQFPSMGCNIKWKPGHEPDY